MTTLASAGLHARVLNRNRVTTLANHYIEAFAEEKERQTKRGQVSAPAFALL